MIARALSFGCVAAAYERFRPGYPDELVDAVLAYSRRPVATALELGAGTGKATRAFAARGIALTATDPDAAMLAELRKHLPPEVVTVRAGLEDLQSTSTYDLVFAAASLHWTAAQGRWRRVAALLRPDGTFASFGGQMSLADAALEAAVRDARSPFLADDGLTWLDETSADSPMQWPGNELAQHNDFTDVRQVTIERRWTISASEYVGHLSTVSAYLELPTPIREQALERILAVLPGHVTVAADLVLHLARFTSPQGAAQVAGSGLLLC